MVTAQVPTEEEVQASVKELLETLGYKVLQTSRRGIRCSCGRKAYGGDGATKGVPDLLIRRDEWPHGSMLGMEVKRPGGKWSSPEQEGLWKERAFARVECLEDAAFALLVFEGGALSGARRSTLRTIAGEDMREGVFAS